MKDKLTITIHSAFLSLSVKSLFVMYRWQYMPDGLMFDFDGVFEHIGEPLNLDKADLPEILLELEEKKMIEVTHTDTTRYMSLYNTDDK